MQKRIFLTLAGVLLVVLFSGMALRSEAQSGAQLATTEATLAGQEQVQQFTLLNLNMATGEEFLTIPGMSDRMVREYMEYRPYISILQFRREIGKYVGDEQTAEWEKYVFMPIQIDESDVESLKQIPAVTDEIANDLIAGRPYNMIDVFLTKLATYLTPEQVEYGANFIEGYVAPTPEATLTATQEPFTLLNLNTASGDEFLTIPDMSNRMVREYMEYRPYISILQFRREIGKYVGDEQTAAWEKYVFVPVQIDQSDVETLKQIPGVTDEIANALIAGRPYNTNEAFLAKLATYLTPEQVEYAGNFLETK
jgi:DNA uptake protein ComE-like DNA-binding protein